MATAPVRTLVVDDEKPARTRLLGLLQDRPEVEVVGVGSDGREAIRLIEDLRPQLVFLDVEMPHADGFGVLRSLAPGTIPVTVFVTAYDRFAIPAFEAHAVDYLLKPYSDERFEAALTHAIATVKDSASLDRNLQVEGMLEERTSIDRSSGYLDRIVVRMNSRIVLVNVEDVDWIAAAGVYVEIHVGDSAHLYRSSLNALLQRLAPRKFIRVHRSVAVNSDRIVELRAKGHGDYLVVLKGGRELPLSRAYRAEIEGWLGQPL